MPRREGTGHAQTFQRFALQLRALGEIQNVAERRPLQGRFQPFALRVSEIANEMEAQAQRAAGVHARPVFAGVDFDRLDDDAVPPRVVHEYFGGVKAHRLHVENRRGEDRRIVAFHVRRRVGQQREARRVRLWEAVVGKPLEHVKELLVRLAIDAVGHHALHEPGVDRFHAFARTFVPHRAAQAIGLAGREPGRFDRHAHALLLKERHAQRALQDRLELGMRIDHRLASGPAP